MSAHRHAKMTILQPTHAGLKPAESSPVGPHWGGGGLEKVEIAPGTLSLVLAGP